MFTNIVSFEPNNDQVSEEVFADHVKSFSALFDGRQISLNLDILQIMLTHELGIDANMLEEKLATVLPYMLAFYIKNWPGWQITEQERDSLNYTVMFQKFREYLIDKLDYLIKNGYDQVKKLESVARPEQTNHSALNINASSKAENFVKKNIAPFTLSIMCPPNVMGTLVFADCGEDLIIRVHPDMPWKKINENELLNWPHVSVNFISPELSFKRTNCGEYKRYLNLNNGLINSPEKVNFIEQINIVDSSIRRTSFTFEILEAYTKEYINILKHAKQVKDLNIIELLFKEFLTDIKEIEMNNTMATNTSVLFNIGKSVFVRCKTASLRSITDSHAYPKPEVCFLEFFIPKMETTLFYFKGVQDMNTADTSFVYLNKYKYKKHNRGPRLEKIIPTLLFTCEYCHVVFNDSGALLNHFEDLHKVELSYKCRVCKENCPVSQLSAQRWRHSCLNQYIVSKK